MVAKGAQRVSGELVQRCQRGDRDAHRELFEETVDDVGRILYRLLGPDADREDLVQEVYLVLWRSIHRFRGQAAFSSYLFGICLRVAKKRNRSRFRFGRLRRKVAEQPVGRPAKPDEELARAERAEAVERALGKLSFKARTVLVLYEMEGLSGREIAERLGVPEKTVWTRLHHARKAFRRMYRWPEDQTRRPAPS